MSRRNAPFYSFPPQQSIPQLWLQYEMELPFLLYIYRDWSIFHRENIEVLQQTFYNFYILYIGPTYMFHGISEKFGRLDIYLFLIWENFVVSSVCWFASEFAPASSTKSSSLCSAAIFQLFFRWRRNCSNLLMQAKRNNLWEKIFLEENKTLSNKL